MDERQYHYTPQGLLSFHDVLGDLVPDDLPALVQLAKGLPPGGTFVEVGSFLGLATCFIARTLLAHNPTAKLYCVDRWDDQDLERQGLRADPAIGRRHAYDLFRTNLMRMELVAFVRPLRMPSVRASYEFADESIEQVFLNGDASYAGCYRELVNWHERLVTGGRLCGRGCVPGSEVERAVKAFTRERQLVCRLEHPGSHGIYEIDIRH